MFNNLPGPSSIVETLVSGAKSLSEYQDSFQALFPGFHTLKKCFEMLEEIRRLLEGLSEHRRRKIQIASQRGVCLSVGNLEMQWEMCVP